MAGAPLRHSLTSSRVSCPQSFTGSSCEQNYSSFRSRGPLLTSVACYTYTVLHNTSKWDCLSTIVIFHNYIPLNLHISIYSINLKGGQSCHPISRVQSNSSNLIIPHHDLERNIIHYNSPRNSYLCSHSPPSITPLPKTKEKCLQEWSEDGQGAMTVRILDTATVQITGTALRQSTSAKGRR